MAMHGEEASYLSLALSSFVLVLHLKALLQTVLYRPRPIATIVKVHTTQRRHSHNRSRLHIPAESDA